LISKTDRPLDDEPQRAFYDYWIAGLPDGINNLDRIPGDLINDAGVNGPRGLP
jgi:hypothetical protein